MITSMSKSQREADKVVSKISNLLSTNKLKSGDKLPTEAELCSEFGVSRTVVREALQQLKAIGVLKTITGSGSYVTDGSLASMQNSLDFYAIMTGNTDRWVEMIDIRALLEASCASAVAGEMYTDNILQDLRHAVDQMAENVDDRSRISALDVKFHEILIEASGNKIAAAILNSLRNLHLRFSEETYHNLENLDLVKRNIAEHNVILDAIEARNPEGAANAMRLHLSASRLNLLNYIEKHKDD